MTRRTRSQATRVTVKIETPWQTIPEGGGRARAARRKGRGAKGTGFHGRDGKFVQIKEMIPELVVPELAGFKLKPYVNYRAPEGTDTPLTAKQLFLETAAPAIEKDFKAGTFDPEHLEKYGFEPTQEGKLFQLYPKNFPR